MNWKRVGRLLVCLVLVAALLVQVSPIRARAVSAAAPVIVDPDLAIAASLGGLGISPGEDPTVHAGIVQDAINWLKEAGDYVSDGLFAYKVARATGDYSYFVDQDFLQGLFDWLFDAEVVTSSNVGLHLEVTSGYPDESSHVYTSSSAFGVVMCVYPSASGATWSCNLCAVWPSGLTSRPSFYIDGSKVSYKDVMLIGEGYYTYFGGISGGSISPDFLEKNALSSWDLIIVGESLVDCASKAVDTLFTSTDKDLTLNHVGVFGSILPDVYTEWFQNSTTITDIETGEEKTVVPIGVAVGDTPSTDYTQEEIWTGTAPTIIVIEDSSTGDAGTTTPDVEPEPDVTPDTDALTQAGFDASLASFLASLGTKLAEWFDRQFGILDAICSWVESIYGYVESIAEFIVSILTLFEPVAEWFEALITGQTTIIDSIIDLPGLIGDVMTGVLTEVLTAVFVPSADYLTVKVDALRARFPFIDGVIVTGEYIRDSISGDSGPPVIYVDLGRASSGNYGSQRVLLTDFSWYAEYKPTVDSVLSAALWAFFGWRVFLKLPGIISGESGYIGEVVVHREKMEKIRSGPPRKG